MLKVVNYSSKTVIVCNHYLIIQNLIWKGSNLPILKNRYSSDEPQNIATDQDSFIPNGWSYFNENFNFCFNFKRMAG